MLLIEEKQAISSDFKAKIAKQRAQLTEDIDNFLKTAIDLMEQIRQKMDAKITAFASAFDNCYIEFASTVEDFLERSTDIISRSAQEAGFDSERPQTDQKSPLRAPDVSKSAYLRSANSLIKISQQPLEEELEFLKLKREENKSVELMFKTIQRVFDSFGLKGLRDTLDEKLSDPGLPYSSENMKMTLDGLHASLTDVVMNEQRFSDNSVVQRFRQFNEGRKRRERLLSGRGGLSGETSTIMGLGAGSGSNVTGFDVSGVVAGGRGPRENSRRFKGRFEDKFNELNSFGKIEPEVPVERLKEEGRGSGGLIDQILKTNIELVGDKNSGGVEGKGGYGEARERGAGSFGGLGGGEEDDLEFEQRKYAVIGLDSNNNERTLSSIPSQESRNQPKMGLNRDISNNRHLEKIRTKSFANRANPSVGDVNDPSGLLLAVQNPEDTFTRRSSDRLVKLKRRDLKDLKQRIAAAKQRTRHPRQTPKLKVIHAAKKTAQITKNPKIVKNTKNTINRLQKTPPPTRYIPAKSQLDRAGVNEPQNSSVDRNPRKSKNSVKRLRSTSRNAAGKKGLIQGIPPLAKISADHLEINLHYNCENPRFTNLRTFDIDCVENVTCVSCIDSRNVIIGSKEGLACLVDLNQRTSFVRRIIHLGDQINCVVPFGEDRRMAIVGMGAATGAGRSGNGGRLKSLNFRDFDKSEIFNFNGVVGSVKNAVFVDKSAFVSVGDAGVVQVWDVGLKSPILDLKASNDPLSCIDYMKLPGCVLVGGIDCIFRVYRLDLAKEALVLEMTRREKSAISVVKGFTNNSCFALNGLADGKIQVLNIKSHQ